MGLGMGSDTADIGGLVRVTGVSKPTERLPPFQ
jgi:hypothetical protein